MPPLVLIRTTKRAHWTPGSRLHRLSGWIISFQLPPNTRSQPGRRHLGPYATRRQQLCFMTPAHLSGRPPATLREDPIPQRRHPTPRGSGSCGTQRGGYGVRRATAVRTRTASITPAERAKPRPRRAGKARCRPGYADAYALERHHRLPAFPAYGRPALRRRSLGSPSRRGITLPHQTLLVRR